MLIHLFGGLELRSTVGEPIRPATRKASLLIAALAVLGEKGAQRGALCELFWPDPKRPRPGEASGKRSPLSGSLRPRWTPAP